VFDEYIYRRENVMPRIHSQLRSRRRRSLQVPHLRTSKDYLYRRVSGQILNGKTVCDLSDGLQRVFTVLEKKRGICNVILTEYLALHITLTNVMEERLPTDT